MPLVPFVMIAFVLYCVLDIALSEAARIRGFPKVVWLLLVVLLPPIGGIAWLVAGRPAAGGLAPGSDGSGDPPTHPHPSTRRRPAPGVPGSASPLPPAPRGPDDDPEFLRRLEERLRRPDDDGTT